MIDWIYIIAGCFWAFNAFVMLIVHFFAPPPIHHQLGFSALMNTITAILLFLAS